MKGVRTKNIEGKKFGYLTAVKEVGRTKHGAITWLFLCDCGNERVATGYEVVSGVCYSCGCKNIPNNLTHGMCRTKEYNTWCRIISRCYNVKNPNYYRYGGRGIKMCDRWRNSFDDFLIDMGLAPSKKHSIDRIDNNGNYEKDNCRWATPVEQSRNRSSNRIIEINGEKKCMIEWCEHFKISWHTVKTRLRRGEQIPDIFLPPNTFKKIQWKYRHI